MPIIKLVISFILLSVSVVSAADNFKNKYNSRGEFIQPVILFTEDKKRNEWLMYIANNQFEKADAMQAQGHYYEVPIGTKYNIVPSERCYKVEIRVIHNGQIIKSVVPLSLLTFNAKHIKGG